MRSQEENYQLRLVNSSLMKQAESKNNSQINSEKQGEEKLLSELINKIHMNEREIGKLNQLVCQLEEENYALKQEIKIRQDDDQGERV